MKKLIYGFRGKVKDLLTDLEDYEDYLIDKKIEEGFRENNFCDNYGYCCGSECEKYYKCKVDD